MPPPSPATVTHQPLGAISHCANTGRTVMWCKHGYSSRQMLLTSLPVWLFVIPCERL